MKDLTQGPIQGHIIAMAAPIAAGMLIQTLYFLVDLYFVGRLGDAALAGVGSAGNVMFIIMALTQALGVGAVTLISHAVGRKDQPDANLVFNQSLSLAALFVVVTLLGGYGLGGQYAQSIGADAATAAAGSAYLYWFLPGLALQFPMVVMGSALRGTGVVKPTMIVQMVTVLLNIVLAPVLIAGWGTGHPLGVAGAGLASTLSVAVGVVLLTVYFVRLEHYVGFDPQMVRPRLDVWRRMLNLGLPAGGEFLLMFVHMAVIYAVISGFGSAAQAGFGLGSRVMQSIFLPAMAIAFSVPAIAGQNFGARRYDRVRETFWRATLISASLMVVLTLAVHIDPGWFIRPFTGDPAVVVVGATFLQVISWNFVASGINFTCSAMFQALGNTWPALLSTGTRLLTFAVPAVWLSWQPGFALEWVWYLSVATMTLQALVGLLLVRWQMNRRLVPAAG